MLLFGPAAFTEINTARACVCVQLSGGMRRAPFLM
jgi:hypothetical protein